MLIDKNDASKEIKEAIEERIKSEFDAVTTPGEDWSKTDFGMGVSSGVLKRVADEFKQITPSTITDKTELKKI